MKYEKSPAEQALIRNAGKISDIIMRVLLAVLKPGMLETQVAAWGYFAAREMGAEELGFDIMVGANESNRSLIGKKVRLLIEEVEGDILIGRSSENLVVRIVGNPDSLGMFINAEIVSFDGVLHGKEI